MAACESSKPIKIVVSAPGKVILHGEHSVVYGHLAIAASLNLRSKIEYTAREGNSIRLQLPSINLDVVYPLSVLSKALETLQMSCGSWQWDRPNKVDADLLIEGIKRFLDERHDGDNFTPVQKVSLTACLFLLLGILYDNLHPFMLNSESELEIGAGIGSSASYSVCLAAIFLRLASRSAELNEEKLNLISTWAQLSERVMHGNPSGLDTAVCTFGSVVAFRRQGTIRRVPTTKGLHVLLVNTRVSRNTRHLVEKVCSLRTRHPDVVNAILKAMDNISLEVEDILQESDKKAVESEEDVFKRLEELWDLNQNMLAALKVSHPTLDTIVHLAHQNNLSAKLTGAGGGGFALVLVSPSTPEKSVANLCKKLKENNFDVVDVTLGGKGVTFHKT